MEVEEKEKTDEVVNNIVQDMVISQDDASNMADENVSLEERANLKLKNKDTNGLVTDEIGAIQEKATHVAAETLKSQSNINSIVTSDFNEEPLSNIEECSTIQSRNDKIENVTSEIIISIIDKIVNEENACFEINGNDLVEVPHKSLGKHKEDNENLGSPRSSKRKRIPKKMELNDWNKVEKLSPPILVREKVIVETPILWNLADLVWAYVPGHPLWPCMVTLHPEENVFTKMKGSNQRQYHMQFLGDSPERGWVSDLRIFTYTSPDDYGKIIADLAAKAKASKSSKSRSKVLKNANNKKIPKLEIPARNKDDWDSAVVEIGEALSCTSEERIEKFGYDFKPFIQHLKKHLIVDKYYTLQELLAMDAEEVELENQNQQNRVEEQYDLEIQGIKIKYLDGHRVSEINVDGEKVAAKNRIRINLDPNVTSPSVSTSAPSRMRLWPKSTISLTEKSYRKVIQVSKQQNKLDMSPENKALPDTNEISLQQISSVGNPKANLEGRTLTINFDEDDKYNSADKNKNQTFKDLFRLVEKDSNDEKVGSGCLVSNSRAKNVVKALEQPGRPKCNYYTVCSCNALDKIRGAGKSYTLRDLLDAVESVKSGVPVSLVLLNFHMPKSVLLDNVNGKHTLTIKHHSDCNLFEPGSAILIRGHVHHLKAIEAIRSLKIYKKENDPVSNKMKRIRGQKVKFANSILSATKYQVFEQEKRQRGRPRRFLNKHFVKKMGTNERNSSDSSTKKTLTEKHGAKNDLELTTRNIHLQFTEKQLRNALLYCNKHYLVNDKKASFFTATLFKQKQINKAMQYFVNHSTLSLEEVSSLYGLEPGFFAESIHFFSRLNSEKDLKKYTLHDIIHAMDDVLSLNQKIGRICRKFKIPGSTLRDCLKRNTDIYNSIVSPAMTRRERLKVLFDNRMRLRVSKKAEESLTKSDDSKSLKKQLKEGQVRRSSRGYYAEDFIRALDDVVHSGNKTHTIAKQYNIPVTSLRDCIARNLPIYHELVAQNLTKDQRLVVLEENLPKFHITADKKGDLNSMLPYKFPKVMELEGKSSTFLMNLFSAMDDIFIGKKININEVARNYKVSYKLLGFHIQFSKEQFECCVNSAMTKSERIQALFKNKEIFYLSSRVYGYNFESANEETNKQCASIADTETMTSKSKSSVSKSKPSVLKAESSVLNSKSYVTKVKPSDLTSKPPNLESRSSVLKSNPSGSDSITPLDKLYVSCSKNHIISALDHIIIGRQGKSMVATKYNIPLDCLSHVIPINYKLFRSVQTNLCRTSRLLAYNKLPIDFGELKFGCSDEETDNTIDQVNDYSSDDDLPLKETAHSKNPDCRINGDESVRSNLGLRKSVQSNNSSVSKSSDSSNVDTHQLSTSIHCIENLVKAIDAVENGNTVYKSANKYGISAKKLLCYVNAKSTIKPNLASFKKSLSQSNNTTSIVNTVINNVSGTNNTVNDTSPKCSPFEPITEAKIKNSVLSLVKWGWFINLENLKVLIKDIVKDEVKVCVSDDVVQNFCCIHNIALTDVEEMIGRSKPSPSTIYNFFNNLESVIKIFKLQDKPSHVYAIHCFTLKSCLKNKVTVVAPINALGDRLAPLIIFEGNSVWCSGEHNKVFLGTQFALSNDGYLTHGIFMEWFNRFLKTVPQRPLLLLYDGSLNEMPYDFIDNLRGSNVVVLKYPYSTDLNNFTVPYGRVITDAQKFYAKKIKGRKCNYSQAEITTVINEMWEECLTPDAILSGFNMSGVYPTNREKYPAETFCNDELHQYCELRSNKAEQQGPKPNTVSPATSKVDKLSCSSFLKKLKVKENSLRGVKKGSSIGLQDLVKNLKYTNVKEHIKSLPRSQLPLNKTIMKQSDNKVVQDALFLSYCKKLRPTMSEQNPELSPEQIESLIWIEWEALSTEEQLLHQEPIDQTPSQSTPETLKVRSRGRPRKLSPMPINVIVAKKDKFPCSACEENYPTMSSLEQHKRWCAGPRQNYALVQSPLGHSSLSAQSNKVQITKLSYKCNQCKERFFSKVSLNVHEKYCTGMASEKLNKSKQQTLLPKTSSKKKSSVSSMEPQDDSASTGSKEEELGSLRKPYFKGPQLGTAKRANICIICEVVGEELLSCTGGCLQSFHAACLNLDAAAFPSDNFVCDDCKNNTHPCLICHKRNIDEEVGEIKRCNVPKCGRSYHVSCLHSRKLSIIAGDEDDKINKGDRYSLLNISRCTLHHCATCASKGGDENFNNTQTNVNKKLMFRCLRCPTAYHSGDECIAAGSLILPGLNIICPEHFEPVKTIPHHQPVHVSCCFVCSKGGELVCCESCPAAFHPTCVELENLPEGEWFCRDCQFRRRPLFGDIVWVKLGSYRWWPGEITHPNEIPDNIQRLQHGIGEFVVKFFGSNDFFWLNKRRVFAYQEGDKGATKTQSSRGISTVFNKAIKEAQARFEERTQHRQKLKEIKTQKKRPSYKHIKINKPVGNVQVHVADQSEINRCICKRTDLHPCGPESECLNRMLMFECHPGCCPSGDKCENQRFQRRDYPTSEVFKTSWGGWGLRTKVKIKKGEFVNEYVGELVDNEECMRRIEQAHNNNVTNFYMLTIDKDRIIDAGPKGNYSRFMNHCCDPTCETQKWTINGDTRVGLFARKDLEEGDELTFNYNLDCLGNDKTPCMCGSQNCSGFIGVRPKPHLNGQHGSRQKTKKKKRLEARLVPKHDDFCFRCRDLGTLVCCDVRGCERAFCLSCLRLTKPPFGKWECPWHHCDFCGRRAQSFCHFCPNSFCTSHVRNQLFPSVPNKYDCCTDHDPNIAEYDMEEAISNAVQAMLPQENWNDSLEIKEESSPSPTPSHNSLPRQQAMQKRGRPKKIENGGMPVSTIKATPDVTESDSDELPPMTSSPVRRKRVKKQYHKRNKRLKSNHADKPKAQIKSTTVDPQKITATATFEKNEFETTKPESQFEEEIAKNSS